MRAGKSTPLFQDYERTSLVISLLFHAGLLYAMLSSNAPHPPPVTTIEVSIEPPQTAPMPKQIVSPSQPSTTPPLNTTKLAEHDSKADVEQIKHGDNGGAPGEPQKQSPPTEKPPEKSVAPKSPPQPPNPNPQKQVERVVEKPAPHPRRDLNLSDLKLDDATLAMKFGSTAKTAAQQRDPASARAQDLSEYQAFSRPSGSGAAFLGNSGISDFLPNLPDGDITLLNAKANTYAGFVRRVAVQVFTQLRSQGWERLSQQQINQLTGFTTIEAILSPDGKFIKAQLIESSGSEPFDGVVHLSVKNGTADPNPPEGARAKDGMIHFIFKARSWAQIGMNRRSGAPMEQRWLLLATGLE